MTWLVIVYLIIDWLYIKIMAKKIDTKFTIDITVKKIVLGVVIIDKDNIYIIIVLIEEDEAVTWWVMRVKSKIWYFETIVSVI